MADPKVKMAHTYEFSILRVSPDPLRGEIVNIGLVIFQDEHLDVRILPSMKKVQALHADLDFSQFYDLPETLNEWSSVLMEAAKDEETQFGNVIVSERGKFVALDTEDYNRSVKNLIKKLVSPTARRRASIKATGSGTVCGISKP